MIEFLHPNPYDPEPTFVGRPLARLFAAINDIQREYPAGKSGEARASLERACRELIELAMDIGGCEYYTTRELEEAVEEAEEDAVRFAKTEWEDDINAALDAAFDAELSKIKPKVRAAIRKVFHGSLVPFDTANLEA